MRILTTDGGGVFGCSNTELYRDKDLFHAFDAFGGTSIGAVVMAYVAMGKPTADLPDMLAEVLPKVFSHRDRTPFFGPKWRNGDIVKFAKANFDVRMGSLEKPLFVISLDFANMTPRVFSTLHDPDVKLYDAILSSVSAPTYFQPWMTQDSKFKWGTMVDGGLAANNPSVCTAAGVCKQYHRDMKELSVLSVGTGKFVRPPLDMRNADYWSAVQWAPNIIKVMLQGSCETMFHYIAEQLPLKAYSRFNDVPLDAGWDFDDPSLIPEIRRRGLACKMAFDLVFQDFVARSAV